MTQQKPDWIEAPDWANYVTQQPSGKWLWHEFEPYWTDELSGWTNEGRLQVVEIYLDWKNSCSTRDYWRVI